MGALPPFLRLDCGSQTVGEIKRILTYVSEGALELPRLAAQAVLATVQSAFLSYKL